MLTTFNLFLSRRIGLGQRCLRRVAYVAFCIFYMIRIEMCVVVAFLLVLVISIVHWRLF